MSHPHIIETCATGIATCTLGSYILGILPELAAVLSIVWLSLQIIWFIWKRYKEFKNRSD